MYNKILVPLDGSKRAEAVLPHVEEMANRYGAETVFLLVDELQVTCWVGMKSWIYRNVVRSSICEKEKQSLIWRNIERNSKKKVLEPMHTWSMAQW